MRRDIPQVPDKPGAEKIDEGEDIPFLSGVNYGFQTAQDEPVVIVFVCRILTPRFNKSDIYTFRTREEGKGP